MSEVLEEIISLIRKESNNNEICKTLNITKRELYNYLTILGNLGYEFQRIYYTDGTIGYKLNKHIKESDDVIELSSKKYENNLNILLTSDWHIDNEFTRKDLITKVPEYCYDHKIHLIFNMGDFINGTFGGGYKNSPIMNQIKELSALYDTYPNTLMFGVLGDHDLSGLNGEGISMKKYFDNYRHDIITNYNNLYIQLKRELICLHHHFPKGTKNQKSAGICLIGHSHRYATSTNNEGILEITVPSLSDLAKPIPSMLEAEIEFRNDYISGINIKQIIFLDKPEIISEIKHPLVRKKY